jgi:hypothetical protein
MKRKNPIPGSKPFKPGQSGNPLGKRKGTPNSATIIRKWLEVKSKLVDPLTGETTKMSHYDAVVLAQIAKALKADTPAFKELMDRLEGRAMQRIEAEVKNETINVEVSAKRRNEILKAFKNDF